VCQRRRRAGEGQVALGSPRPRRRGRAPRWIFAPPWTLQQLHEVRDMTDPQGRRRGPQAAHGTLTRWLEECDCDGCREAQKDAARARFRRNARRGSPVEVRKQLLDAIYNGKPLRTVLRDLGLTSNQVWGSPRPTTNGPKSWMPP
jgi:hypothetical protein